MIEVEKYINYYGPEWTAIKQWLSESREIKLRRLVGSRDHDESNVLRGELRQIEALLATEEAALRAAKGH